MGATAAGWGGAILVGGGGVAGWMVCVVLATGLELAADETEPNIY
jgi:hypothetical protein